MSPPRFVCFLQNKLVTCAYCLGRDESLKLGINQFHMIREFCSIVELFQIYLFFEVDFKFKFNWQ